MSYAHLIFGIILFVVFLVTGKFMRVDFPDKDVIPQDLRLLMRSRHIYILFSSLIHILLGLYLQTHEKLWRKSLQIFGSFLLFAASLLLIWAFIFETYTTKHFSDISRYGLYASLAGTIFHLLSQNRLSK
jgi:magnesium-transporting ATPase (P-type)